MNDWFDILRKVAPHGRTDMIQGLADAMPEMLDVYQVNNPLRQAHFIAQMAQECDGFRAPVEYASGKEYEGRADLGNTHRGDGVRFKGRGYPMLTGRYNYTKYGPRVGVDLVASPDKAAEYDISARIAGEYWVDHGCNALADKDDLRGVTRKINGGLNGIADRQTYLTRAKAALDGLHPDDHAPVPLPQGQVKAVQQRLEDLGFHIVGKPDGKIGPQTIAAIAAFQAENGLEVTGKLDPTTLDRLWTAEKRVIPDERANGKPKPDSLSDRIHQSIGSAAATGGVGGLFGLDWLLSRIESVSSYWDRLKGSLGPLRDMGSVLADNWPILLLLLGIFIGYQVWQLKKAQLEAYRAGKIP